MSGLKVLRNRIKSIESTRKITKAMQMVAASKLNKAKCLAIYSQKFRNKIMELVANTEDNIDAENISKIVKALFIKEHNYENNLVIVFSADKGLCGPYNGNIYKKLKKDLANYNNLKLILVGSKLEEQIEKIAKIEYTLKSSDESTEVVKQLKSIILEEIEKNPKTRVTVYYTRFKNTLEQTPVKKSLFPLEKDNDFTDKVNNINHNLEFEGENLIDRLVELYIESNLTAKLLESRASEEASRMKAMDNATRNAQDLIDHLKLILNRTRQAQITSELIEVISGAESLKD